MQKIEEKMKRLVYEINGEKGDGVLDMQTGLIVRAKTGIAGTVQAHVNHPMGQLKLSRLTTPEFAKITFMTKRICSSQSRGNNDPIVPQF